MEEGGKSPINNPVRKDKSTQTCTVQAASRATKEWGDFSTGS